MKRMSPLLSLLLLPTLSCSQAGPNQATIYRDLPKAHALLNSGKFAEARLYYAAFVKENPVLGSQWFNLAQCDMNLGQYELAVREYEEAAKSYFPKQCLLGVAKSYAKWGKQAEAIRAIEELMAAKFGQIMDIVHDDAFAGLKTNSRFKDLVGLPPEGNFSREQKWAYDIDYLVREIKRKHTNPFAFVSEAKLNQAASTIKAQTSKLNDAQIELELQRMLTLVGDGHTLMMSRYMSHIGSMPPNLLDSKNLPLKFYDFPEGVYIVEANEANKNLVGKQVMAIDGVPISKVREQVFATVSTDSSPTWRQEMGALKLAQTVLLNALGVAKSDSQVELMLGPSSEKAMVKALDDRPSTVKATSAQLRNQEPGKHYWFKALPEQKALYVCYRLTVNEEGNPLESFWEQMFSQLDSSGAERLIIDMRENYGGSGELNDKLLMGLYARPKFLQPGRVFALIGRGTFSAAMYACGRLEQNVRAIFVGEPTGGRPNFAGEVSPVRLPFSGLMGSVSTLFHQNTFPTDDRAYFPPRLYAPPTYEAWKADRDPAMELVTEYIKGL